MNRDIKFRFWDIGEKVMTFPHFEDLCSGCHYIETSSYVTQYTGLNDKNGKEIYEGDILEFRMNTHQGTYRGKVIFEKGCFILDYKIIGGFRDYLYQVSQAEEQFEIIGNVYETPQLLLN